MTALSEYVLGLSITSPSGSTWQLAPHFGDLQNVEGGFTTSLGKFQASWTANGDGTYAVEYSVPEGTSGTMALPLSNQSQRFKITIDGKPMMGSFSQPTGTESSQPVYTAKGKGGQHRIEVSITTTT